MFAIYLPTARVRGRLLRGAAGRRDPTTINPLYTVEELTAQLTDAGASYCSPSPPWDKPSRPRPLGGPGVFVLGEAQGATPFAAWWPPTTSHPR